MSEDKRQQTKEHLLKHIGRGRQGALTGKSLAYKIESDAYGQDRHLRLLIGELIEEGYPIASATESPAGFYLAQTRQEVEHYALTLRSRVIKDALRRRGFIRSAYKILHPEQIKMEV